VASAMPLLPAAARYFSSFLSRIFARRAKILDKRKKKYHSAEGQDYAWRLTTQLLLSRCKIILNDIALVQRDAQRVGAGLDALIIAAVAASEPWC
jgi:hypothetical protein